MQSEIDKRILEASKDFIPYDYGHSGDEQRDAFIDGAKFILEMPELKAAFEAMKFAASEDMWESDGEYVESFSYQYKEWYQDRLDKAIEALKKAGLCE